jgi:hypothetical protein
VRARAAIKLEADRNATSGLLRRINGCEFRFGKPDRLRRIDKAARHRRHDCALPIDGPQG